MPFISKIITSIGYSLKKKNLQASFGRYSTFEYEISHVTSRHLDLIIKMA